MSNEWLTFLMAIALAALLLLSIGCLGLSARVKALETVVDFMATNLMNAESRREL